MTRSAFNDAGPVPVRTRRGRARRARVGTPPERLRGNGRAAAALSGWGQRDPTMTLTEPGHLPASQAEFSPSCVYCRAPMRLKLVDSLTGDRRQSFFRCDECGWEALVPAE